MGKFWWKFWIAVPIVFAVQAGYFWVIDWWKPGQSNHGTFGDMFGALNVTVSALAFWAFFLSLKLQNEQLATQLREMRESSKEHADVVVLEALNHIASMYARKFAYAVESSERGRPAPSIADMEKRMRRYEDLLETHVDVILKRELGGENEEAE